MVEKSGKILKIDWKIGKNTKKSGKVTEISRKTINAENYTKLGKTWKILVGPTKKATHFSLLEESGKILNILKNTPHEFRKKIGNFLQKTWKNTSQKNEIPEAITFSIYGSM